MNAKERYLFDLQGYLVIKNVLNEEQLKALNHSIDSRKERGEPIIDFLNWEEPAFRNLINHPPLQPYLLEILGPCYRLDHEYAIIHNKGDKQLHLHGGGTPYDPGQYYHVRNEKIYSGLTVVSFALDQIGPNDGGFCCVPGSHKSNYRVPEEFVHYEEMGPTIHVEQGAGDVLIFTEALTHGTLAWNGAHERRSLLYKYSPGMIAWAKYHRHPEMLAKLTAEQREILEPSYHPFIRKKDYYQS